MQLNFNNSKSITLDAPMTVYDAAAAAELISRAVIAARVNGKVCALTTVLEGDADID